jgi:hypothetical protein
MPEIERNKDQQTLWISKGSNADHPITGSRRSPDLQ